MTWNDPAAAESLLELLDCLQAEYQALLDQDAVRIESALARKKQLLARLASHSDQIVSQEPGGRRELPPAWTQALARARELNRRNAIVLSPRVLFNRARLRCLQGALGGFGLYGADGLATAGRLAAAPPRSA